MIREIAKFKIKPGQIPEFIEAARACLPLFEGARGFHSFSLEPALDEEDTVYLLVEWATLEDHTVHFRESAVFQEWRGRVGDFFAEAPVVVHTQMLT